MNIRMVKFGTALCTRRSGRMAFDEVAPVLRSGESVCFDFDGVGSVTNSFADELFGRLAAEWGMDALKLVTTFSNVDSFSAISIRSAMERRASCALV